MTKMYGVNKNFESAISACTGDYVMICDQDDIWMPDKIKDTLYKMLEVEELRGGECHLSYITVGPICITDTQC